MQPLGIQECFEKLYGYGHDKRQEQNKDHVRKVLQRVQDWSYERDEYNSKYKMTGSPGQTRPPISS